jgi:signal transduction histidine kinase
MKPTTLRRRLYTLLFRWLLLVLLIAAGFMALSFAHFRAVAMEERILISRTLAKSLDSSITGLFQNLQHLASGNPAAGRPELDDRLLERLRSGRFQLFFRDAIYVLDEGAAVVMSDPPAIEPIAAAELSRREAVTSLLRKPRSDTPFVAIIQPFSSGGRRYSLISEMHLMGSALSSLLRELSVDPDLHLFVVDAAGAIIAAADEKQLFRTIPEAGDVGGRILSHRSYVSERTRCWFYCEEHRRLYATVMVPLDLAPWGVVLQQPTEKAFFAVHVSRYILLGMLGLLVASGGVLFWVLSSSVIRPLRDLSEQAEGLRRGELERPIDVEGDPEIKVLAATMDEARQRLRTSLDELRSLNENLEGEVSQRTEEIEHLLRQTLAKDAERRSLVRRLLNAGEAERKRIARELHDEISQLLTVVQLSLDSIPGAKRRIGKARNLLSRTQKELHRIIYDLRPSLLDDLGLPAAIEWYASNYLSPRGLEVHLEVEEGLRLPPEIEITTFRIYQEIITNILRHSQAENVWIELYSARDKVVLTVEDDGVGFDVGTRGGGVGIVGMQERAAIVRGSIRIDSEPGTGTQVIVEFPLETGAMES